MIADYEAEDKPELLSSPGLYGLTQKHKHLPEMRIICGLNQAPVFCPIVDDYYKGMATTVPFHSQQFSGAQSSSMVRDALADFYAGSPLIRVLSEEDAKSLPKLYGNAKAGTDSLDLIVAGTEDTFTVTSLFDNLGKGASGAAIENMNIVLGVDLTTGLIC